MFEIAVKRLHENIGTGRGGFVSETILHERRVSMINREKLTLRNVVYWKEEGAPIAHMPVTKI